MVEKELIISKRLKAILPPLTDEQRKGLEADIVKDGRVTDPILYWWDGKQNVVIDGMHRLEIVRRLGLTTYQTMPMPTAGTTYEEVADWMFRRMEHQRNLTREQIGEWYNRIKTSRGGDPGSKVTNGTLENAAKKVSQATGKSERTVKRVGKRAEDISKLIPQLQKGISSGAVKVTDAQAAALVGVPSEAQQKIAHDVRKEILTTEAALAKHAKIKPKQKPKPPSPSPEPPAEPERAKGVDYGKCPNCAGSKWKEGEDGVLCAKCRHPHGEPAGDVDEERSKTQRQKTVKTAEALLRAFDDLHLLAPNNGQHKKAIDDTKRLLKTAKEWKL